MVTPIGIKSAHSSGEEDAVGAVAAVTAVGAAMNCFYLHQLMLDGPNILPEKPYARSHDFSSKFAVRPAETVSPAYVYITEIAQSIGQSDASSLAAQPPDSSPVGGGGQEASASGTLTRPEWPRGYILKEEVEVKLFAHPEMSSSEVGKVSTAGTKFLATRAEGDWLHVRVVGTSDSSSDGIEGWVLSRSREKQYLYRNNDVEGCVKELVGLPSNDSPATTGRAPVSSTTAAGG